MKNTRSTYITKYLPHHIIFWITIYGTCHSYVPKSTMGEGFCLSDEPTYNLEISGPRMCVYACYKNELCRSVNYVRDLLQCLFVPRDSVSIGDFDNDPDCIHYTSPTFSVNGSTSSPRCNGDECPEFHSCVTLTEGNIFCLRTECPPVSIINGDIGPGNNRVGTTRSATCLTDYEFEDEQLSTTITCRPNGTWTQDNLFCRLQKCPEPTVPTNAAFQPGNITIGSQRYIECLTGYAKIGGADFIECQSGKVWTSWTGQCSLCSEPSAISNADVSSGGLTVGSQRTYSCQQNYFDNGESPSITCQNDATWSSTSFSCSLGECPEPSAPANAVVGSGSNEIGQSRTISCQTGYAMTGSQTTIVCQSSQVWTSWSGTCITCSEPPSITGATVSSGSLTVGSTRTYSCGSGYVDNGVSGTITCQAGASWSQTSFACNAVCPTPPTITNGAVQSGSNSVGSQRTITCNTGYALSGSQTYIECQSNQVWTTFTGSCITCSTPGTIQYASISSGTVTVGSQRTYSCNTGYQSNGQSGVITCQSDAAWSSTSFSCSIVDCGSPPTVSNAASSGSTVWNSVVTYTCNHGFYSNGGGMTITCQSSASWSSVSFYCIRVSTATISFESSDTYNFVNSGASFGWTKTSGGTSSTNTGPTGAYHGTYYRYFETSSPTTLGSRARMISDVYFDSSAKCIDFYYNMYGIEIGTVYLKYVLEGSSSQYTLWSQTGNKGTTSWFNAKVSINVNSPYKVVFEATDGGNDYYGDAAIDYVRIKTSC